MPASVRTGSSLPEPRAQLPELPGISVESNARGKLLRSRAFADLPGIEHAFETRGAVLGAALPSPVARLCQMHSATVVRLPESPESRRPFFAAERAARPEGDALITDLPAITVAVAVADCLPILIADPVRGAVGAVHGGWRSLAAGIVPATLAALAAAFGCRAADCHIAIGPGIGPCCYEVGEEVFEPFAARGLGGLARAPGARDEEGERGAASARFCNLSAVVVGEVVAFGVPESQVSRIDLCTRCFGRALWSYRLDGEAAGRMLGGIARA